MSEENLEKMNGVFCAKKKLLVLVRQWIKMFKTN
jgi:hypothetical protein